MKYLRKFFGFLVKSFLALILLIAVLAMLSALYNLGLPTASKTTEVLPPAEKSLVAETMRLQRNLGDAVWPGWGGLKIPVIVYNEAYAFLLGYPDPPAGWHKMPSGEFRGGEWQRVEGDDFYGTPYYRQQLTDPERTPENFTVRVGDRWAATIQTREYSAIAFYNGFRTELPGFLRPVFPYKLVWNLLMGDAENYIGALSHEAFHAWQGTTVPQRLARAEEATRWLEEYPWQLAANAEGWKKELQSLLEAYRSEEDSMAAVHVGQFLKTRADRRARALPSADLADMERQREWLEGLAKYAELSIGLQAQDNPGHIPVEELQLVRDFKHYKTRKKFFDRQIGELNYAAGRDGESRFYYGGMVQALLLNRLMPDWKTEAFEEGMFLEDLLGRAADRAGT